MRRDAPGRSVIIIKEAPEEWFSCRERRLEWPYDLDGTPPTTGLMISNERWRSGASARGKKRADFAIDSSVSGSGGAGEIPIIEMDFTPKDQCARSFSAWYTALHQPGSSFNHAPNTQSAPRTCAAFISWPLLQCVMVFTPCAIASRNPAGVRRILYWVPLQIAKITPLAG